MSPWKLYFFSAGGPSVAWALLCSPWGLPLLLRNCHLRQYTRPGQNPGDRRVFAAAPGSTTCAHTTGEFFMGFNEALISAGFSYPAASHREYINCTNSDSMTSGRRFPTYSAAFLTDCGLSECLSSFQLLSLTARGRILYLLLGLARVHSRSTVVSVGACLARPLQALGAWACSSCVDYASIERN